MFAKKKAGLVSLALASVVMSGAAMAVPPTVTGNVHVTADLTAACEIVSTATIDLGQNVALLNASSDKIVGNATDFKVACTTGHVPAIYSDTQRTLVKDASHSFPFSLSQTNGGAELATDHPGDAIGGGWTANGALQSVPLYVKIAKADFGSKPAGTYTRTVTMTVAY